jgi:hypothetical protein
MQVKKTEKILTAVILLAVIINPGFAWRTYAQPPDMEWHKGFGTDLEEHVHEGWQTSDLGYIGIGQNWEPNGEYSNMLIVKVDSAGMQEWITELGTDNQWDVGLCVQETADGYIVGGGFYNAASGNQDRGLAKLGYQGDLLWKKTYPGNGACAIRGVDIYEKGEIVATGYLDAEDYGFVFIVEEGDGFVMKTDAEGNLIWDQPVSVPQGTKVRIENNGGLAVASTQWVYHGGRDNQDVILVRTDSSGKEISAWNYGGSRNEHCYDFELTMDGGYIFAGHTRSYGVVNWDYMLMKIDGTGTEEWTRTFGQPRGYDPRWIHDESYGVRATPDGGYIIAGGSGDEYGYSAGGHASGPSDEWKVYIVKTDSMGNMLWEGVYPANSVGNNAGEFIALTDDGGYIIFTDTDSQIPPEPNNFGFMKIAPDTISESIYYELTLTINGEGSVFPMNKYHMKDSALTISATPSNGWKFDSWSGDVNSSANPVTISPGADMFIVANFQNTTYVPDDHESDGIHIYPNPVKSDYIVLELNERWTGAILELIDSGGRRMMKEPVRGTGSRIIIKGFDELPGGLYILRLETDKKTVHKKILIK